MALPTSDFLFLTCASLYGFASILHLGCILFGEKWYRFFGAGEKMLEQVRRGARLPSIVTLAIAGALLLMSAYNLSAAGIFSDFPFHKFFLWACAIVLLARALLFAPLMKFIRGNSLQFWLVSSAICLMLGCLQLFALLSSNSPH